MSKPNAWVRGIVAVATMMAVGGPVSAAGPDVWITMARGDAQRVGASRARSGREAALTIEQDGPIVVARIGRDDVPLLARAVHEELHRCGGFFAHASRDEALGAAARVRPEAGPAPLVDYTIDNGP